MFHYLLTDYLPNVFSNWTFSSGVRSGWGRSFYPVSLSSVALTQTSRGNKKGSKTQQLHSKLFSLLWKINIWKEIEVCQREKTHSTSFTLASIFGCLVSGLIFKALSISNFHSNQWYTHMLTVQHGCKGVICPPKSIEGLPLISMGLGSHPIHSFQNI